MENELSPIRHPFLLNSANAALVVIDVQSILLPFIWEKEKMLRNIGYVLELAHIHELPTIVTEHNPKGLGPTDPDLVEELKRTVGYEPLEKNIFSCCGHEEFVDAITNTGRHQIIVVGMESHICVNQTVLDLIQNGFQVHVVEDAVRCRWENSHKLAMKKMRQAGAVICDWEMAAYELTYGAKTPEFKQLLKLMKRAKADYDAGL
ncbi:MAG: isochorismatase family protein [bacterium]|nr:isochorismatase family protein [bacterium]